MKRTLQDVGLERRLKLVVFIRPLFLSLVLGIGALPPISETSIKPIIFIIFLGFVLSFFYWIWLQSKKALSLFLYFQIIVDISLITLTVKLTGGIESQYSLLFLVPITYSSLFLGFRGGILSSIVASSGWLLIVFLDRISGTQFSELILRSILFVLYFFIMGFLFGYLAEKVRRTKRELEIASEALETAKMDTEEILANLGSGVLGIDAEGRIAYLNKSAETILGFSPLQRAEIKGKYLTSVFNKKYEKIEKLLLETLGKGILHRREEVELLGEEGEVIPVGFSTTLLLDGGGEKRGVIAIFQDLREIKTMEEKIREADRLAGIGELAKGMLEQVREPLGALHGLVKTIVDTSSQERFQELAMTSSALKHEVMKLDAIIKSLVRSVNIENDEDEKTKSFEGVIIGKGNAITRVLEMIEKVADSESTILILGESGTGKELVAQEIHRRSRRAGGPFISINCGALPETLLESELFGHLKGSFTGAVRDRDGLLKVADGGTFFLDEVSETTPAFQVKLLRFLQEREIVPVGGTKPVKVNVRLLSATNKELDKLVEEGRFRADLFYRLNVIPIRIPPLRERKEDIPLLTEFFLKKYCEKSGIAFKKLSQEAMDILFGYNWPGNVRELENIIERVVVLEPGRSISADVFPEGMKKVMKRKGEVHYVGATLKERQKEEIIKTLEETKWNKAIAARRLGIHYSTLYRKLKEYGVENKSEYPVSIK